MGSTIELNGIGEPGRAKIDGGGVVDSARGVA